jgi:hypothetical protein
MGKPWQTLEAVVKAGQFGKAIKAGDTVWLRSGFHGTITLSGGTYAPAITISAPAGQTPQVSRVSFAQTHGWVVKGLSISPSFAPAPQVGNMVQIDKASSDVVVRDCEIFSVPDASAWDAKEWIDSASSAVQVSGDRVTISGNRARNVRFGISVDGPNALVENNQVVNFSADGLRGLGDFGVFQYNLVKNVYVDDAAGDTNHDDGFQSWSVGSGGVGTGVVTGVVLRGNVFLNREDPNQKLTNAMQGVGCFDGLFDGWVVENNVVVTDHWHGISFYGMRNSRIVNNTVIDVNNVSPGPPWIMVTPHKDGRASENVVVRNNLATDFDLSGNAITQDHNTTLTNNLAAFFVDPAKFDLHLLANASAVDTGSADEAPPLDADRIARPQGKGVDLGAYEWHDPAVKPDAGAGTGGAGGSSTGAGGAAGKGGTGTGGGAGGAAGSAGSSAGSSGTAGVGGSIDTGGHGGASSGGSSGSGGSTGGAGGAPSKDGGSSPTNGDGSSGCGCDLHGSARPAHAWLIALTLPLWRYRRRRRHALG